MRLLRDVTNKNFDSALMFVTNRYPNVIHQKLKVMRLLRAHQMPTRMGEFVFTEPLEIRIRNGNYPVEEFVDTLAHELTHLRQWIECPRVIFGLAAEAEAERAGRWVRRDYEMFATRHRRLLGDSR